MTTVDSSFAQAIADARQGGEAALATWWRGFDDPLLDRLVDEAFAQNQDLRVAAARVAESRALRGLSRFDLYPTVTSAGGYSKGEISKSDPLYALTGKRVSDSYDAGFDASWELDLFGRVRRSMEAADADLAVTEADRLSLLLVVTSDVVREFLELRGLQAQWAVARQNVELQEETLKITQERLEGGRGNELDVARSRSLLNQTRATIPSLEASIAESIHRLAVLTGRQPTALLPELFPPAPLPPSAPEFVIVSPASLLRRRPDIRGAERRLAASTARIGVATADLFPRLTVLGSIGGEAGTAPGLEQRGAGTWSFGPMLSWAAFDLGRVRARIRAADALADGALAAYEQTVLLALEETEDSLVAHAKQSARLRYLQDSVADSQLAVSLIQRRYEVGNVDFLSVLDAERTLLDVQNQAVISQTQVATSLVAVYKAFGAGLPAANK